MTITNNQPNSVTDSSVNQQGSQNTLGGGTSLSSSTSQGSASNASSTQNQYQPWQQDLQQTAAQQANQFLTTGVAPNVNQQLEAEKAAYITNFNQNVAPQLAAQYGAGSPAIASQLAIGLQNLTSDVYQNANANYNNALNSASGIAFNATGANSEGEQQQQSSGTNKSAYGDWQNQTNQLKDAGTNLGSNFTWKP